MENGTYSSSSEASSVSSIAPSDDVEVKKLKDLVKKLEKQNEHLRHRTGKLSSTKSKLNKQRSENLVAGGDASNPRIKPTNGFTHDDNDDLKELDDNDPSVRNVVNGDELTWLYESPKPSHQEDDDIKYSSPLDWLNEDIENPSTPQLASSRRNMMYKIGVLPPDNVSPDLSYLTKGVEKRLLFHSDDYKMEDATDVRVVARLQQDELNKNSPPQHIEMQDGPFSNNVRRRSHSRDNLSPNSPPPTQLSHHLPVPSQTMTTTHGLYPAHNDHDSGGRRSATPTRLERSQPSSIGSSPRNRSPVRSRQSKSPSRRTLPTPSRTSPNSSIRNTSPSRLSQPESLQSNSIRPSTRSTVLQQPTIRSSLVAPGRISRLQQKSALPNPTASSALPSGGRSLAAPRAPSPMNRRSLPRPSQTKLRYSSTKLASASSRPTTTAPPAPVSPPQVDIWGDDDVY